MTFQQTVNVDLNEGVPGDLALDGPFVITPVTLAANGTLGYFFTIAGATGLASPGGSISTDAVVFGGIAVNPKDEPLFGSSASAPFNPNLSLFANGQAQLLSQGACFVSIPNAWEIGDLVAYNTTTGALSTYAPGGSPGGGSVQLPGALMTRFGSTAAGVGIVRLLTNA